MDDRRFSSLERALDSVGLSLPEAMELLRAHGHDDLGFSRVDWVRGVLAVLPEVVLGQGKTPAHVVPIVSSMLGRTGLAMVSRVSDEMGSALSSAFPEGVFHALERFFVAGKYSGAVPGNEGSVAVVTAGTSDLPVAGEAALVLRTMGVSVELISDVGVAGIHRLGPVLPRILSASVCIVCAGMDAALVSVLGGLFPGPVVAVPVSTGYGASLGGLTALFSSLSSCSPGIGVMNIDNGLGAAAFALRHLRGTPY
jgi:hypothetical protein